MNHRIRKSGLSSKEICYKRDIITNSDKQIEDKLLIDNTINERKRRHKKPNIVTPQPNICIGHNVFLKEDNTKLRARELYKVVDIFLEDDEEWATVQKHHSQFRMKKYKVKISELILLPGQTGNDKAGIDIEVEENNDPSTTLGTIRNEE